MVDFLAEVRRLEWAANEGLWAPAILEHTDTRLDFAGANYAPFDEIINGYTVEITGVAERVDLLGSNNNFVDVLVPTGVAVVPSNSAGLQIVSVGSGLDATQQTQLRELHANEGLELGNPMTVTSASRSTDDATVDLELTGDGVTTATVTRQ